MANEYHSNLSGADLHNPKGMTIGTTNILIEADSSGNIVINEGSADRNFRIEGSSDFNLFSLDAGLDSIGFGTLTPSAKVDIVGLNNKGLIALEVNQLDVTQNPVCMEINNDGTSHGLYLHQDGVLATNRYGLYIYSVAAQINSNLVLIHGNYASSTADMVNILNIGTNCGTMVISHTGIGTGDALTIDQDGTSHGLYLHQDGVLASSKYGLYVYSNAVQINSPLVYMHQDNGSATADVCQIINDGTGQALYLQQTGARAASKYTQYIYTTTAQIEGSDFFIYHNVSSGTDSAIVASIYQEYESATGILLNLRNDGTGNGIFLDQNSNGSALNIDSEATSATVLNIAAINTSGSVIVVDNVGNQASGTMISFTQNNASSVADLMLLDNDGTGNGLYITQDEVLAVSKYGLYIYSNASQANSPLVYFYQDNAASVQSTLYIKDDSAADTLKVEHNGIGNALHIDVNATADDIARGIYFAITNSADATKAVAFEFAGDTAVASVPTSIGGYIRIRAGGNYKYLAYYDNPS